MNEFYRKIFQNRIYLSSNNSKIDTTGDKNNVMTALKLKCIKTKLGKYLFYHEEGN